MKNKIAIIGTVGLPAKYGGFETLAEQLVRRMGREFEITVYCTKKKYPPEQRAKSYLGARLVWLPFDANGIWSIPYDCLSILHALFFADVLLVLGVSGGLLLPFVRRFTRKKLVVSIDGIEWKRDKWSRPAKWYLWWAEKTAVRHSHADIADNEAIQDYTARRYQTLSNIIEYGADHVLKIAPNQSDLDTWPFLNCRYAFNVCRIEPENNIHLILSAFHHIPDWPLVIVGNWNNSDYGRQLRKTYGNIPNITLLDPIYDQARLDLLRGNAALYLHGHSAGGTNPSLVEAMYLGLPILAYGVSYNKTTTESQAGYFSSADDLVRLVHEATPEGLAANAARMKAIALRRYTWEIIASRYAILLRQALVTRHKSGIRSGAGDLDPQELLRLEAGHLSNPLYFYEKR